MHKYTKDISGIQMFWQKKKGAVKHLSLKNMLF